MTVTLSGLPRKFARSTRRCAASSGSKHRRMVPISSSSIWPESPSLQSKYTSPVRREKGPSTSTLTSGVGPTLRVMMFRGTKAGTSDSMTFSAAQISPYEAVVESQLLQFIAAEPVDAAIADVSDESLLRQEDEGANGGSHASQFIRLESLAVDFAVGFPDGLA